MKSQCRYHGCQDRGKCRIEEWGPGGRVHTHRKREQRESCSFFCDAHWTLYGFIKDVVAARTWYL